jgi:hypothetical protein
VFLALCYVVLQRILQLAVLRVRSNDFKELEIVVLRHELAIMSMVSLSRAHAKASPALAGQFDTLHVFGDPRFRTLRGAGRFLPWPIGHQVGVR